MTRVYGTAPAISITAKGQPVMQPRLSLFALFILLAACQGTKLAQDPEAIKKASIMTSRCILDYPEVPGQLTARQKCLNTASGTLLNYYNQDVRTVALACAQKLTELAQAGDTRQVNINQYETAKQRLQMECQSAAKAKLGETPQ